jgi:hypothetical protein
MTQEELHRVEIESAVRAEREACARVAEQRAHAYNPQVDGDRELDFLEAEFRSYCDGWRDSAALIVQKIQERGAR